MDLVFFFHGWYSSIDEAAQDFDLYRQFAASGTKALLVIPETAREAPDSYGGKLERDGGFNAFVNELLEKLEASGAARRPRPGRIALAGHSGAYRVISQILGQRGAGSRVAAVYLFDALYADLDRYADWILGGKRRFVSIGSAGGDPEENSWHLADSLRDRGVLVTVAKDDPSEDIRALAGRVVFLTSPYAHSALISQADEFRRVLAADARSN